MKQFITERTFSNEAKMLWDDYKIGTVLVEGETDILFLSSAITDYKNIKYRSACGWENVVKTAILANSEGFTKLVCVIDKDYHELLSDLDAEYNLLFTDKNDLESMLFYSIAFDKFLRICGSADKLQAIEDPRKIILDAAIAIGRLRVLAKKYGVPLKFEGIDYSKFIDKKSLKADANRLVELVCTRTCSGGTPVRFGEVWSWYEDDFVSSLKDECINGHDILNIVCIAMQKVFGTYQATCFSENNVLTHLLMGYGNTEFQKTALYKSIDNWYRQNIVQTVK